MNDYSQAAQLLSGFYSVESNSYRWTARDFSVALAPPPGAAERGARLNLKLYFPEMQLKELGPMELTADVAGNALAPETFSQPGTYVYSRDVPACWLESNLVPIEFSFDKYMPPSSTDNRNLGAVVTLAELVPK